jgi:hypothetical protein
MLCCGNIILLTVRFLDVAKFTTLTPLSLLISCKLSFPIVGFEYVTAVWNSITSADANKVAEVFSPLF